MLQKVLGFLILINLLLGFFMLKDSVFFHQNSSSSIHLDCDYNFNKEFLFFLIEQGTLNMETIEGLIGERFTFKKTNLKGVKNTVYLIKSKNCHDNSTQSWMEILIDSEGNISEILEFKT